MKMKEYKEMMKTMTEHEEYKNADVPKEVWVQRNEYLHKHIDRLYEEIKELRRDNKKLTKQVEDQLKQFRNSGSI
jgi:predicted  nucleic acid-binding Zn-ribbon protein